MKSTGIVRTIDELGRIVLPKELRRTLNIKPRDEFEFHVEDRNIILKRNESACIFCNKTEDTVSFQERNICRDCIKKIAIRLQE
jgi:transcriptional pleiotropic regulator of transition state genes